ncbi:MAG: SDR family NAD(P)-dependent oxidoreductase, partial [Dehalococcoidia bacterium]|nr:SDR family NAD(P)-dependent oxidoreductase [Dehalococcoidia bacterium]
MDIKGKTAFVTGGASGLGEATVRRLHGAGANVVIADFNRQNGEAFCKQLGDRAAFV